MTTRHLTRAIRDCFPSGRTVRLRSSRALSSKAPSELFGTVISHQSYILLHSPNPPSSFDARHSTPLQRALQLQVGRWGGIVNFTWRPALNQSVNEEAPSLTAFSTLGGRLEIPAVSLSDVDKVSEQLREHALTPQVPAARDDELHLYVCTHGARDCRCGDIGGGVLRALREETDRRVRLDPNDLAKHVVLGEVAHVGGHKHAANVLVFPHGEWLGNLTPQDVPAVLDDILKTDLRPSSLTQPPLLPQFWRGRMGLSKEEQINLYAAQG